MKSTSKQIVFFGTDAFSLTSLTALLEADYPVSLVITKPDSKQGRGQKLTPSKVKVLAARYNIPVLEPQRLLAIHSEITKLGEPTGILSSYGKIIPQSIIDLFTPGIINIHPSLLPKYRGPTPIESAVANGDEKTAVSLMQLAAGMDNGPVYTSKEVLLSQNETSTELYHTLATVGANLLLENLPAILDGSLTPIAQNEDKASYTKLLTKQDAWLTPSLLSAAEAERRVRAHLLFPKTKIQIEGHTVIITKARVSEKNAGKTDVRCSDGKYLSIEEVIAPSGRRMSAEDFERGYLRA